MKQVVCPAEDVMTDEADQKQSIESTLALPLAADEALRAIDEWQTVYPVAGFSRHGNQVKGDAPLGWECEIDGEMVAGTAAVAVTILVTDDKRGGCLATITLCVDLSDAPIQVRED